MNSEETMAEKENLDEVEQLPQAPFSEESKSRIQKAQEKYAEAGDSIFKLSTSALALSITFKSSLVDDSPVFIGLLALAWIYLAVAPLCYVCRKLNSADLEMHWFIQHREQEISIANGEVPPKVEKVPEKIHKCHIRDARLFLNMRAGFFIGIAFLLLFAIINLF